MNIVRKCGKEDLMLIIKSKVFEGSTVHSDGWKSFDGLILKGCYYRVYYRKNEFIIGKD